MTKAEVPSNAVVAAPGDIEGYQRAHRLGRKPHFDHLACRRRSAIELPRSCTSA
jgi:hypothetical protein